MKNKKKLLSLIFCSFLTLTSCSITKNVNIAPSTSSSSPVEPEKPEEPESDGNYLYTINSLNEAIINGLVDPTSTIFIYPKTINGLKVGGFASERLKNIDNVKKIVFKQALTAYDTLAKGQFSKVYNLESIEVDPNASSDTFFVKNNCLFFKDQKFSYLMLGCKNSVIPSDIGNVCLTHYSFSGSIPSTLYFPANVIDNSSSLDGPIFSFVEQLEKIEVDPNNTKYKCINNVLYHTVSKNIVYGYGEAVIPSDIKLNLVNYSFYGSTVKKIDIPSFVNIRNNVIGSHTFQYSDLEEISINNTDVTTLTDYTFAYSKLKSFTIPSSVTNISGNCFVGCSELTTLNNFHKNIDKNFSAQPFVDTNLKKININSDVNNYKIVENFLIRCIDTKYQALIYLGSEENIRIPETITSLGQCIFKNNKKIKHITLLKNRSTYFNNEAFVNSSLETIDNIECVFPNWMPDSNGWFKGCHLKELKFGKPVRDDYNTNSVHFFDEAIIDKLIITPESSVKMFSLDNFRNATIKSIELEEGVTNFKIVNNNLLMSGDGTTLYLTFGDVSTIEVPEGVTTINPYAFSKAKNSDTIQIKSIHLPSTLTTISEGVFQNLNIDELLIPDSIKGLSYANSFSNSNIKKLVLPKTLTSISNQALTNSNIGEIEIPASVNTIGTKIFENSHIGKLTISNTNIVVSTSITPFVGGRYDLIRFNSTIDQFKKYCGGNNVAFTTQFDSSIYDLTKFEFDNTINTTTIFTKDEIDAMFSAN